MKGPYEFDLSESCPTCTLPKDGFFCQFSAPELREFDAAKFISGYPAGAVLFVEEQKCRGIFVLCKGEAKLTCGSSDGRTLILRIAKAGEALGLESALSGGVYEATAETLGPCQVAFVPLRDFERFLREHPLAVARAAGHLGRQYRGACRQLRVLGLGASTLERLARLLLAWSAEIGEAEDGEPFTLALNHEEIAEYVGTTRESVTRALTVLRERGLI
jgi:CRP/FNR family transcriptional regulator, cyclic AMP receptor protein